jgi:hypothetical protein
MRWITFTGLAAALVLSAAPAAAAKTSAKDQTLVQESAAAAGDRKICRRLQNTGTRLRNDRVCLTKAEWKKIEDGE